MKKVLFLGGLTSGGAEHQMVVIATLLQYHGYDITYMSDDEDDFFQCHLEKAGVRLLKIKNNKFCSLLKLSKLRLCTILYRELMINKYDTVVSFIGHWNFLNCILGDFPFSRHRVITGIRNNRDEVFLSKRTKFYNIFEKYTYKKVSNSKAAMQQYVKYYPQLSNKLVTIYNIVTLPQITSTYVLKRDNKLHVIVPASYRAVKNPMRLLEAVTLIDSKFKELICIEWYGSIKNGQECYNEMDEYITKHELRGVVKLNDATTNIADRIYEADFVGLFSTSEGLPNAICEGMMLGKPILMSKVSDYSILVDNSNGFLCDAYDPKSIADVLMRALLLSDSRILEMGQSSMQKGTRLFSSDNVLKQWIDII